MMTPPLLIPPTPRPGSMASRALGSQEGALPTSALLPQAQPGSARPRAPPPTFPPPSCPMEQSGCSEGLGGHGLAPKGGGGRGAPRQGGPSPPSPSPPALRFSSDQTRNKENVWNLSCCLLFLFLTGQGPRPHGQDVAQPPSLQERVDSCLGPGRCQRWAGGCTLPPSWYRKQLPRVRLSELGRFYFFKNIEK